MRRSAVARHDLLAGGAVLGLLAVAVVAPRWRYAVGLTVFCVWMAWFVVWTVGRLSTADD